jgi:hypothetical protein
MMLVLVVWVLFHNFAIQIQRSYSKLLVNSSMKPTGAPYDEYVDSQLSLMSRIPATLGTGVTLEIPWQ